MKKFIDLPKQLVDVAKMIANETQIGTVAISCLTFFEETILLGEWNQLKLRIEFIQFSVESDVLKFSSLISKHDDSFNPILAFVFE